MPYAPYVKAALRADRLAVVKNVSNVACDPHAVTRERLRAMELLLNIVIGPSNRPADDVDVVAARSARNALSDALPLLEQTIKSRRSGRVRARAAKLALLIVEIDRQSSKPSQGAQNLEAFLYGHNAGRRNVNPRSR